MRQSLYCSEAGPQCLNLMTLLFDGRLLLFVVRISFVRESPRETKASFVLYY